MRKAEVGILVWEMLRLIQGNKKKQSFLRYLPKTAASHSIMEDLDFSFALSLQQQFYNEASNGHKILTGTDNAIDHLTSTNYSAGSLPHTSKSRSVVDSDWELIDPTPDVLALFQEFNKKYFWERLNMVEVKWSKRMTL